MIDIKKALSQRCYIIFDSNEQLRKFVDDNKLQTYIGINDIDIVISVNADGEILTVPSIFHPAPPRYHHSQLTITDDGE